MDRLRCAQCERLMETDRKRRGGVTAERIRTIRTQYGLSQRALARLLRLGEITINRYENGAPPSGAHNGLLILIENPVNVKKLLDEVGSDLSAGEEAYVRSKLDGLLRSNMQEVYAQSAQALLGDYERSVFSGFRKFSPDKVREMVLLAANRRAELSKIELMKILFCSDFLHFKEHAVSISGLRYARFPLGPAVDGWNIMLTWLEREGTIELTPSDQDWGLINATSKLHPSALNHCELAAMDLVIEQLGSINTRGLSELTQLEKAYLNTKQGGLISYEHALDLSF